MFSISNPVAQNLESFEVMSCCTRHVREVARRMFDLAELHRERLMIRGFANGFILSKDDTSLLNLESRLDVRILDRGQFHAERSLILARNDLIDRSL